jgi:hypothetical protein
MRLCTDQFNNLGSDGLHLANRQLPGAVKDDFGIRREQAIWTHIAVPTKSSRSKIALCEVNTKTISKGAAGDLTEHYIIPCS